MIGITYCSVVKNIGEFYTYNNKTYVYCPSPQFMLFCFLTKQHGIINLCVKIISMIDGSDNIDGSAEKFRILVSMFMRPMSIDIAYYSAVGDLTGTDIEIMSNSLIMDHDSTVKCIRQLNYIFPHNQISEIMTKISDYDPNILITFLLGLSSRYPSINFVCRDTLSIKMLEIAGITNITIEVDENATPGLLILANRSRQVKFTTNISCSIKKFVQKQIHTDSCCNITNDRHFISISDDEMRKFPLKLESTYQVMRSRFTPVTSITLEMEGIINILSSRGDLYCGTPLLPIVFPNVRYQLAGYNIASYSLNCTDMTKAEFLYEVKVLRYGHYLSRLYELFVSGFITRDDIKNSGLDKSVAICKFMCKNMG